MIIGIGNDIIEVERVRKACEKEAFLTRCFTKREIESFKDKPQSLAGNFAVKESVAKAFGTGLRKIKLLDIEVLRNELGAPYVNLYNEAEHMAKELGVAKVHVSISNLSELAVSFVVLEG